MRISTKVRYGLRALVHIANGSKDDNFIRIKEIAEKEDLKIQYLEQILFLLKKNGFITGKRGPYGGYKMAKAPEDITLYDIYMTLEDENKVINCNENMEEEHSCGINGCDSDCIWGKMNKAMSYLLKDTTLAAYIKNAKII